MDLGLLIATTAVGGRDLRLGLSDSLREITGVDALIQRVLLVLYSDSSAFVEGSEFVSAIQTIGGEAEARQEAVSRLALAAQILGREQSDPANAGLPTSEQLAALTLEDFTMAGDEWEATIRVVAVSGEVRTTVVR